MAICRWSSDDFDCDFYIYQDASFGGITMWIANNRTVFDRDALGPWPESPSLEELMIKPPTPRTEAWSEAYSNRYRALMDSVRSAERINIDHPHAGGHFRFETPAEVVEFLEEEIIPSGKFHVPDWLIEELQKWELIEDEPEDEREVVLGVE